MIITYRDETASFTKLGRSLENMISALFGISAENLLFVGPKGKFYELDQLKFGQKYAIYEHAAPTNNPGICFYIEQS